MRPRVGATSVAILLLVSPLARAASPTLGKPPAAETTAGKDDSKKEDEEKWKVSAPPGDWGWSEATIDTTEGTWISLDVSPDGKSIVFDLLGDLYLLPIKGGDARPLRSGLAWFMQPRFSPDGGQIAFTSDEGNGDNLWVMGVDGKDARAVTKESFRLVNNPAWDPTGDYLVAKKHFTSRRSLGAGEMWLYHLSGGAGVQMTKRPNEQKDVNDPAFSPDGRYLYYDRDATPGRFFEYNKDSSKGIYRIERLDRETGEIVTVTGGPGGAARPTPSPDGKSLAFVRRVDYVTTLFIRDLDSGAERPIYSGLERDNQEVWALHGVYPSMAWTPDGRALVFWDDGQIKRIDVASGKVSNIPFRVRAQKKVAKAVRPKQEVAPEQFDLKMLRSVVVSPRKDRVAFTALGRIWIRDLPKGQPKRLTRNPGDVFEHDPAFSRDGRSIVYGTWSDRDLGTVRIVSARGGKSKIVSQRPGHFIRPVFSPDGRNIMVERVEGGYLRDPRFSHAPGIYRLPVEGGPSERVVKSGSHPQFGERSHRLYFTRRKGDDTSETRTLVALDLEKRTERVLYESQSAQGWLVSPDGRWLALQDGFHVYLTPFVETGRTLKIKAGAKGIPMAKVTKEAGDALSWSGDGRSFFWSLGPELFERPLTDAFAFLDGAPEELPEAPARGIQIGTSVPADRPSGTLALVGAKLVTMKGDEVIENGAVVVRDHRIVAVGARAAVKIPRGTKIIDVTGKTIVPGFIDAHAHGAQGTDGIIPQHNWRMFANLAFGVTTIHDPSNDTATIFSASEMQRAGIIRAPRIFSTGRILYGASGIDYKAKIETLEDALFHLKRLKAVGAFSVKSYNQPRRDQRQKVLEAARQLDMQVVPEGGATFMHNLTMIADGHTTIEHNIPVESLYGDVLQFWDASDTAITPTLVVSYGGLSGELYWYQKMDVWRHERLTTFVPRYVLDPRARRRQKAPEGDYNHIRVARGLKQLVDRGRLVNTGAHGQLDGLAEHWEMWMFAQGGLTPLEVLRSATLYPARTLGMDEDLGSLEAGKLADLVVLEKDPLQNIRNTDSVGMVMQNGRLYDAKTMDQLGHHPDAVGSQAFGDGPKSLGIGQWWGGHSHHGAHGECGCRLGTTSAQ